MQYNEIIKVFKAKHYINNQLWYDKVQSMEPCISQHHIVNNSASTHVFFRVYCAELYIFELDFFFDASFEYIDGKCFSVTLSGLLLFRATKHLISDFCFPYFYNNCLIRVK